MLTFPRRGLLRPDKGLHLLRIQGLAPLFHQAPRLPPKHPQAAAAHREGRGRRA